MNWQLKKQKSGKKDRLDAECTMSALLQKLI